MGRSYKKVPAIKEKEIIKICKSKWLEEVTNALFYSSKTLKNRIKEKYEEY